MHFPNNLMMIISLYNYSPASETSLSFRGDGDASTGTDSFSKPDKTRSCIFMEGDYNMTTRNVEGRFITTQKRDFAGLPAAGISTVTRTPYSHVTPKYIAEMSTVQCNMFFNACPIMQGVSSVCGECTEKTFNCKERRRVPESS